MPELHPRILSQLLEDLTTELTRLGIYSSDALKESLVRQTTSQDALTQAHHEAKQAIYIAQIDAIAVSTLHNRVSKLIDLATQSVENALAAQVQAETGAKYAQEHESSWRSQLVWAKEWKSRATIRLDVAKNQLIAANRALQTAESLLSSMQSALQNCERSYTVDKKGNRHYRDCSGYRASVSQAAREVTEMSYAVSIAKQEVGSAEGEVARSSARISCCSNALAVSAQATIMMISAVTSARDAVNTSSRALEEVYSLSELQVSINSLYQAEALELHTAEQSLLEGDTFSREAHASSVLVSTYEDNCQRIQYLASNEINIKIDDLYRLNAPSSLLR